MSLKKQTKRYLILAAVLVIIAIGAYLLIQSNMTGLSILNKNPQVKITTTYGDIIIELYPKEAPITVENFLSYVDSGFYNNTVFHRVINDFMIQGGGFTVDGQQKKTNSPIKLESDNGLENLKGTIAMARTNVPDSATSQFFINTVDNAFLDYNAFNPGYAVFGKVIEGMDIVEKIQTTKTTTKNNMQDWPVEDVFILKVERI